MEFFNLNFKMMSAWNPIAFYLCVCVSVCTPVVLSVCKTCSTHLVWKESFDLSSNGIKIPTDIVRQEAGCKDRKRRWVTEGESYNCKKVRECEAEIEERRSERTPGHVSALWYMQQGRGLTPPRGSQRDMESDRVNLWGTDTTPPQHTVLTAEIQTDTKTRTRIKNP